MVCNNLYKLVTYYSLNVFFRFMPKKIKILKQWIVDRLSGWEIHMLGECHGHIILDGIFYKRAMDQHRSLVDESVVRAVLKQYQENKITFFRDGGDSKMVSAYASHIAKEYGIDYRTPITAIYKKGYYGSIVGTPFEDWTEYRQLIKKVKKYGGDFIKIMISGILDFSNYGVLSCEPLKKEEIKMMVTLAKEEGFSVMAHVNGSDPVRYAIEAGVDSIEHGYYMDSACIQELADSKIVWVPTCSPIGNSIGLGKFEDQILRKILVEQEEHIKEAIQQQAVIALGSDAGAYQVFHGLGVFTEYEYIRKASGWNEVALTQYLKKGETKIKELFRRE